MYRCIFPHEFPACCRSLKRDKGKCLLFDNAFSRGEVGIPINGLVWMGSYEDMLNRMETKLEQGFGCIKLNLACSTFYKTIYKLFYLALRDHFMVSHYCMYCTIIVL